MAKGPKEKAAPTAAEAPPGPEALGLNGGWKARCCRITLALSIGYLTWGFLLLQKRGDRHLGADPRADFSAPGAAEEGSCPAGGGHCTDSKWWTQKDQLFNSKDFLQIETLTFNRTIVEETQQRPLLVAFFDPRSQSFNELRADLEEAAALLAARAAEGRSLGRLAACDASVHTFLSSVEAPELNMGWQESKKQAFRFGQPRFFPLILVLYERGRRVGEYTGVVKSRPIATFMERLTVAVLGGERLEDAAGVERFLAGKPGPFAVGCGMAQDSAEGSAFNRTAHELRLRMLFATAPGEVCEVALGQAVDAGPQVVWVDGSQKSRVRSLGNSSLLADAGEVSSWLRSQRLELMEEMTPDTSHKYLDRREPLLILLVDPTDKQGFERGAAIVAGMEEMEGRLAGSLQLVWSDCMEFGPQFGGRDNCPMFVAVVTQTLLWYKVSLDSLEKPGRSNASAKLLGWLDKKIELKAAMKAFEASSKEEVKAVVASPAAKGSNATNKTALAESAKSGNLSPMQKVKVGVLVGISEEYNETMPSISWDNDLDFAWSHYHAGLSHLLQLQRSFMERYSHLDFDFSDLAVAQKLHPFMRSLAPDPASVQEQVQDPEKLARLRRAIEWQASFQFNHTSRTSLSRTNLLQLLHKGYELVRQLWLRLFRFLHGHAAAGTLGVAEAPQRRVERRAGSELSVREFMEKYARPGLPVIITGVPVAEEQPWTLDFFKERCNVTAEFAKRNPLIWAWGRLEKAGDMPLAQFLDGFASNATLRSWYLHDWSLPQRCPAVFGPPPYRGFTVPKYFAGDYFQRASFDSYQHTWPSLFVGSEETESAMHIDSGGTNFWLSLLSGRKEWRFYSRRDLINLYQNPLHPHFLADPFSLETSAAKFPLIKYAEMYVGVQEPGDIMFIPGGNPHAVRNLEPIVAVSMNYADSSNIWMHLWHMLMETHWDAFEMFTDGVTVPHGMRSDQESMRFGEWKSRKWKEMTYDM